jgi:carboxypeptidase D
MTHHNIMAMPNSRFAGATGHLRSLWLFSVVALLLFGQQCLAADKSAADYFIRSLPGQPEGPLLKMHAG